MKKKSLKLMSILLLIICVMTSCNKEANKNETTKSASGDIENLQGIAEAIKEEEKENKDNKDEKKEIEEQNPPEVSSDWSDMEFGFENASYKLNTTLDDLKEAGWTVEFEGSEVDEDKTLEPDEKVAAIVHLKNEKYDEKLQVNVGFINDTDENINILSSKIWTFECSIVYGFKMLEAYPKMVIGNGITWGSTKDDIESAFGNPDLTYDSKNGHKYTKYTYKSGINKCLELTIYDEYGLVGITMMNF